MRKRVCLMRHGEKQDQTIQSDYNWIALTKPYSFNPLFFKQSKLGKGEPVCTIFYSKLSEIMIYCGKINILFLSI